MLVNFENAVRFFDLISNHEEQEEKPFMCILMPNERDSVQNLFLDQSKNNRRLANNTRESYCFPVSDPLMSPLNQRCLYLLFARLQTSNER